MKLRLVMFVVIGPLFAFAGFLMLSNIDSQRQTVAGASQARSLAGESAIVGALIHELQKERGYSAGFIASSGVNFPNELSAQRGSSDAAIADFWDNLFYISELRELELSRIAGLLGQLDDIRGQVNGLALSVPDMANFYTNTINLLIETSRPLGAASAQDEVTALLMARALIGSAKEAAGLERAMGATGLGSGFEAPVFSRYLRLNGAQNALLFEASSVLGDADWLASLKKSDAFHAIESARKTVVSGVEGKDFNELTAGKWFEISTSWINLLREEELKLIEDVSQKSSTIELEAATTLTNTAVFGLFVLGAVIIFAIYTFEKMIARINALITGIHKFTSGDYSLQIEGREGTDELSNMSRAIFHFKQDTLSMRRDAEQLKADQERKKLEQDRVVAALRKGLNSLSDGDLTQNLEDKFPKEYEDLRCDFNSTISGLNDAIRQVANATGSIRSGSGSLERSSQELSHRAGEQASNIRQTAAKLEDVTSSMRVAAQRAGDVTQSSNTAKASAIETGPVVKKAIDAMEEISGSSEQIAQIISVIEDIAFQTNLLALNAGVEAARAGDSGRGFAVVATEVRALAHRSSEAAMQINSLIDQSAKHVRNGVEMVNQGGSALDSIASQVSDVSGLVSSMAKDSVDQARELQDINEKVSAVDAVTQETTAMVHETKETCVKLNDYAEQLEQLVRQFKLYADPKQNPVQAA